MGVGVWGGLRCVLCVLFMSDLHTVPQSFLLHPVLLLEVQQIQFSPVSDQTNHLCLHFQSKSTFVVVLFGVCVSVPVKI